MLETRKLDLLERKEIQLKSKPCKWNLSQKKEGWVDKRMILKLPQRKFYFIIKNEAL